MARCTLTSSYTILYRRKGRKESGVEYKTRPATRLPNDGSDESYGYDSDDVQLKHQPTMSTRASRISLKKRSGFSTSRWASFSGRSSTIAIRISSHSLGMRAGLPACICWMMATALFSHRARSLLLGSLRYFFFPRVWPLMLCGTVLITT